MFNFFNKKKDFSSQKLLTKELNSLNTSNNLIQDVNNQQDLLQRMILNEKIIEMKSIEQKYNSKIKNTDLDKPTPIKSKTLITTTLEYKVKPIFPIFFLTNKRKNKLLPPKPPPPSNLINKAEIYKISFKHLNTKKEENFEIEIDNLENDDFDIYNKFHKNTIFENGSIFGLSLNRTSRKEVLERMSKISKVKFEKISSSQLIYEDIGIIFTFNGSNLLQEITINEPFSGETTKGLKIHDSINKAIEIYGIPKMRTALGAIWENFSVFLNDDVIKSIRLRKI